MDLFFFERERCGSIFFQGKIEIVFSKGEIWIYFFPKEKMEIYFPNERDNHCPFRMFHAIRSFRIESQPGSDIY